MHKPSNTIQQVKEWLEKRSRFPFETMKKWDALYYIQQLESTISQVNKVLCGKENATFEEVLQAADQVKNDLQYTTDAANIMKDEALKFESRLAQVERERDAAVHDLEEVTTRVSSWYLDCDYCKYKDKLICENCDWQWRGVCTENTKEDA